MCAAPDTMAEKEKIKVVIYWAAGCGGCDVATLDIEEKILDVITIADIVFWPMTLDFKYEEIEAMEAGSIDVCMFNGAVRNAEHEAMATLLREKAKVMVAFGSCACFGGIPGLGNVANEEQIYNVVYNDTPSTVNPEFVTPQTEVVNKDGKSTLPEFWDTVKTLDQVVAVDYYVPGCPPVTDQVNDVVQILANYAETGVLPPKGASVAFDKTLCDECNRERAEKKSIKRVYRPHEVTEIDPDKCLLDQGIICMGPATRGGCGTRCITVNMPCRGCMGPSPAIKDPGAAFLSAIASILGVDEEAAMTEQEIEALINQIKDPLGTFYRFTLPNSILRRVLIKPE